LGAATVVALAALGCSGQLEAYTADGDTGSTHALVGVERSVDLVNPDAARAGVIAGFVQIPADVDAKSLFELVGLSRAMPGVGQCRARGETRSTPPLSSIGHVEFLEAGDVSVSAADARTSLAPHAFPTVTELISGVVYTTRDRSADPLPAGTRYAVTTSGGGGVPALSIEREAPPEIEAITVGGELLSELAELVSSEPLYLTWSPGAPGDIVLVEVSSGDGAVSSACAFRDEHGAGTVPALGLAGAGRIALHRVRTTSFDTSGLDLGELRFDFEVAAGVTFTE
jgi:hypothetical protein